MRKIEVFFVCERNNWFNEVIEVPDEVAVSESQDVFEAWTQSPEAFDFRESWDKDVIAVFVMSWRGDLKEESEDGAG